MFSASWKRVVGLDGSDDIGDVINTPTVCDVFHVRLIANANLVESFG
jgi:hypothetical protein